MCEGKGRCDRFEGTKVAEDNRRLTWTYDKAGKVMLTGHKEAKRKTETEDSLIGLTPLFFEEACTRRWIGTCRALHTQVDEFRREVDERV